MRLFRSARWLMLALLVCLIPASSNAGVFISINFGPPVLPVYEQPICPQPNLIWMPGYWAYGDEGYFWVPGAWVPAPFEGGLWTPPYWGWSSGLYVFHPGYWGYHVGYYGGVNYGYGYGGIGFAGGEWRGHNFAYNTAVMHVDERVVRTTYIDRTIVERNYVVRDSHVAYSGGPGGINHPPAPEERLAEHEQHTPPTTFQSQHITAAQSNKQAYAKFNSGRPTNLTVARPLPMEMHQAPPMSHSYVGAGAGTPKAGATITGSPANGTYHPSTPQTGAPKYTSPSNGSSYPGSNPGSHNPSNNTEMRTVTPPHNNTVTPPPHYTPPPPRTYSPPKGPPPPKPEGKPKPEGHEK